ncbi:Ig-like domain-containing protein [Pyxidicoccus fallax]|uniref:Ig-like domain-containing protein n=1 Tax=Pyxidicoccus fallax TaxID=394095 RepID=A0A848LNZ8_9BACT|nr:Ig-like domain-containing protein [Pyxidicoccus fallax]NMO19578.1 Ig-like domain-containing protein [Pyxidicoccus fallax]NPC83542.1 Ig-like domain-containing protein [Pyxidicoccus fallax]
MNSPRPFLLLPWVAVVLLSAPACINVPDIEPAKAQVRIASPDGTAYTNGVIEVRLTVTGHSPERVELLRDGEVLTTLEAPYAYAWDTAGVAEGAHRLEARAVFGDVTFTSEAREVVVDRTPPSVVSRTPEPGDEEVWVRSPIRAVFSEPVKASTLTEASVRLTVGGVEVARTVSLSADGRTVTVEPVTPVTPPNMMTLYLSDALADLAGNKTAGHSGEWTWALPTFVRYPSLPQAIPDASSTIDPIVRLDKSGNPVVLRQESDDHSTNIFVSRWTGSRWENLGAGLKISSSANFIVASPSLQIGPDGEPVAAWHEGLGREFDNHIHVARWTGSEWKQFGDARGILPDRPHALNVSLQLTPEGAPIVAFKMDPEDISGGAVHVYQWSNDVWSPLGLPHQVTPSAGYQTPALTLETNNAPVVAFTDSTSRRLYARRWTGKDWEELAPYVVTYDSRSIRTPALQADSNNNLVAIWGYTEDSTGAPNIALSHWSSDEWRSLQLPATPQPQAIVTSFNACRAPDGSFLFSWNEFSATETGVHLYRWTASKWERLASPLTTSISAAARFSASSIDSDTRGTLVLAGIETSTSQPLRQMSVVYRLNR